MRPDPVDRSSAEPTGQPLPENSADLATRLKTYQERSCIELLGAVARLPPPISQRMDTAELPVPDRKPTPDQYDSVAKLLESAEIAFTGITPTEAAELDAKLFEHPYEEDVFRQWLDTQKGALRGLRVNGKVVSYILVGKDAGPGYMDSAPSDEGRTAWFHAVGTDPDFQGHGVAGLLIENEKSRLACEGFDQIKLVVDPANDARHLYAKRGFTVIAQGVKDYFRPGENRDVMAWSLADEADARIYTSPAKVRAKTSALRDRLAEAGKDQLATTAMIVGNHDWPWDIDSIAAAVTGGAEIVFAHTYAQAAEVLEREIPATVMCPWHGAPGEQTPGMLSSVQFIASSDNDLLQIAAQETETPPPVWIRLAYSADTSYDPGPSRNVLRTLLRENRIRYAGLQLVTTPPTKYLSRDDTWRITFLNEHWVSRSLAWFSSGAVGTPEQIWIDPRTDIADWMSAAGNHLSMERTHPDSRLTVSTNGAELAMQRVQKIFAVDRETGLVVVPFGKVDASAPTYDTDFRHSPRDWRVRVDNDTLVPITVGGHTTLRPKQAPVVRLAIAPETARSLRPGSFVVLRLPESAESRSKLHALPITHDLEDIR